VTPGNGAAACPPDAPQAGHQRGPDPDRDPTPCVLREGRLIVDDVDLAELADQLEGHAVWLLSHGAIARCIAACDGPRTVSVGRVGPPVVLGMFAAAGWWARCHTPRELQAARAAGFPAGRLVATGRVKDDGFLKDALSVPVGVLEIVDDVDAANVARLAAFLECALPPSRGQPAHVAACELHGCGGLLAPVLRGSPQVALDAPWCEWAGDTRHGNDPEAHGRVHVWPLEPGPTTFGTFEGLTSVAAAPPTAAHMHGGVDAFARGAWALVLADLAFGRPFEDPAWPTPETVMTRDGVWRFLEEGAPTG
jgi:hypothetical protein